MGFSGHKYWSGLPCPPPGDLPHPGTEPTSLMSPALSGRFFTTSATWETHYIHTSTYYRLCIYFWASQVVLVIKNPYASAGDGRDMSSIPGSGRSLGGRHGYPLQYSCPEKPGQDRGAWQATVHGSQRVRQNWNDLVYLHLFQCYGIAYYTVLYRDDTEKIFSDLQLRGKMDAPEWKRVSSSSPLYPRKESSNFWQLLLDLRINFFKIHCEWNKSSKPTLYHNRSICWKFSFGIHRRGPVLSCVFKITPERTEGMSARCSDTPGTVVPQCLQGTGSRTPVDNKIQGGSSPLSQWSSIFLAPRTSFMEDNFSRNGAQAKAGGYWFRQQWKWWGAADEAWLTCPPLTSCCDTPILTTMEWHRYWSSAGGLGIPVLSKME